MPEVDYMQRMNEMLGQSPDGYFDNYLVTWSRFTDIGGNKMIQISGGQHYSPDVALRIARGIIRLLGETH